MLREGNTNVEIASLIFVEVGERVCLDIMNDEGGEERSMRIGASTTMKQMSNRLQMKDKGRDRLRTERLQFSFSCSDATSCVMKT